MGRAIEMEAAMSYSAGLPAIYQRLNQEALTWVDKTVAFDIPVELQATTEPVWPEDEELEERHANVDRYYEAASDIEVGNALRGIRLSLPDRMNARSATTEQTSALGTMAGLSYVSFSIQPTIQIPDDWTLRRLAIDVMLEGRGNIPPVAVTMDPPTNVDVERVEVGEVGVDLGKLAGLFIPGLPQVLTGKLGAKLEVVHADLRVLASGLSSHNCGWRIADRAICYRVAPSMLVEYPAGTVTRVSLQLRAELQKHLVRVFHKAYFKSAQPRSYIYNDGAPLLLQQEDSDSGVVGRCSRDSWARIRARYKGRRADDVALLRELAQAGNVQAMGRLGDVLTTRGKLQEGERWYREASHSHDAPSMMKLAKILFDRGSDDAPYWYEMAGSTGDPSGWRELGAIFEGTDRKTAAEYYRRALSRGDAESLTCLRKLYKSSWWLRPSLWLGG